MNGPSRIYRAALGASWDDLPAPIRRFHEDGATRAGRVSVVRGSSRLARLLCHLLRMPAAGRDLPASLAIAPVGAGEVWSRRFGDRDFATRQWLDSDGHICELVGSLSLVFRLSATMAGLDYRLVAIRPLPAGVMPQFEATERLVPDGNTLLASVRVHLPHGNLLIAYDGTFTL